MSVPRDGLLAEYLGEIAAGAVQDSSGNGRHAAITGTITQDDTAHDTWSALLLDGSSYATIPAGGYVTGNGDRTTAAWFYKPTAVSDWDNLLGTGSATNNGSFDLAVTSDGRIDLAWYGGGVNFMPASSIWGDWHLLCATFEGATDVVRLYYDGVLVNQGANASITTTNYGYIGRGAWKNRFAGRLSHIRLYDRQLTDEEVLQLYAEGLPPVARLSMPHALLVGAGCPLPHALRPLEAQCALPLGLSLVAAGVDLPHGLRGLTGAACALPHALRSAMAARCGLPHALASRTPVLARIALPHAAYDVAPDQSPPVSCSIAGREVALLSLELTADEDSFAVSASLELARLEDWLALREGDFCLVTVGDSAVHLLLDSRTRSREFGVQRLAAEASSPGSRLAAPFAAPLTRTWEDATARSIAAELCAMAAVPLDWRICDWTLAHFAVEARTPMEALAELVTAAARVLSGTDGAVVVQYRYPQSPAHYHRHPADLVLSDFDDILQLEQESLSRPCYDAVQLLSEAQGGEDGLWLQHWQGANDDQDLGLPRTQRMVAVFAWPEREASLRTTGCDSLVQDQGAHVFEHEELVAFVDGQARLRYPARRLLDWAWRCEDLGDIQSDGAALQAQAATPGCSLARVRYESACRLFLVESRNLETVQVVATAVDSSQEPGHGGGLQLTVQRGAGARPSPETIVDPLCTSLAILRQRGRNYLDEQGYTKELCDVLTPPRPLVLPGALVQVTDGSLQEKWRAKLTGWQVTAGENQPSRVRWTLERSL